jgi:RNase H-fold protein (predicted Holliday junction resolvase)
MPLLEDGSFSPFCYEIVKLFENISCNVDSLCIKMGENNSENSIHNQSIVTFWNERNSTVNARQVIKKFSKKRNVHKQSKDSLAASLIMQGYLDSNNINQ